MDAAVIIGVIGLILLGVGWTSRSGDRAFAARAQSMTGEVVDLVTRRNVGRPTGDGRMRVSIQTGVHQPNEMRSFFPVVSFQTADGRQMRVESPVGSNPAIASEGQTVDVLYDPANPEDIRINSRTGRGGFVGTTLTVLGSALVAIAIVIAAVAH